MVKNGDSRYNILPQLFLRAPVYSYAGYDLLRLSEILRDPVFRHAIWLASPEFYGILETREFDERLLKDKERYTLYKYYNRMCFRPTPFGSFASFTVLHWSDGTRVSLAPNSATVLHLLPDQELLDQLNSASNKLDGDEELVINPSLYRFGNVFRYYKSVVGPKGKYKFSLEAIAAAKFNTDLFAFLGTQCKTFPDICAWISSHTGCTAPEASDYLQFLLDEQVVYSRLQECIICVKPATEIPGQSLRWKSFWRDHSAVSLGDKFSLPDWSRQIQEHASPHSVQRVRQPFYSALERPIVSGGPGDGLKKELLDALELLHLLNSYQQPQDLTAFKERFKERFDQEKVPLLTALDPDSGLPYGNLQSMEPEPGILENIQFPDTEAVKSSLAWNAVSQLLFRLWANPGQRGSAGVLALGDNDRLLLKSQLTEQHNFPNTQSVMYRDTGEHLVIEHSGGVTAASLIGRFSSFSGQVHTLCRELAAIEINANPDIVFADIGALTDMHVDNINRRKPVYDYEIPVNVFSAQPEQTLIRPSDLLLSVQEDELILVSQKVGRRVVPRLTTAFNFRHNHLPLFRFLCDLQFQGIKTGVSFDLEQFFPDLAYYPRVSYGRVVISAAKWVFREAELGAFFASVLQDPVGGLNGFRKKHGIPRHITIGSFDQELVFDLGHVSEAALFLQCVQGLESLTIKEYFVPDRSVVTGNKPLSGQYIAFLAHHAKVYHSVVSGDPATARAAARNFMLGSTWLYLKIFCTPGVSDIILTKVIYPLIAKHKDLITGWFFIRYSLKGYHLRLRIRTEAQNLGILLAALNQKLAFGGFAPLVKELEGDTYRREIERYTASLIPDIEDVFRCGSDLILWHLRSVQSAKSRFTDFELALLTSDRMIGCFLNTNEDRLAYLTQVVNNFLAEFQADKKLKITLDEKYRLLKATIDVALGQKKVSKYVAFLLEKTSRISRLTASFSAERRYALLADLVHMQLNRTFTVRQRQQELFVYYCLQKQTRTAIARAR